MMHQQELPNNDKRNSNKICFPSPKLYVAKKKNNHLNLDNLHYFFNAYEK